jgi:hypothetical protein
MIQKIFFLTTCLILASCTSVKIESESHTSPARKSSSEESPALRTMDTVLYNWSDSTGVKNNPSKFIDTKLKNVQECFGKISKQPYPVDGCEGNGFKAGPGLYFCDNPFTSHDYGNTVLIVRAIAGQTNFANYISEGWGSATGGVDRELYGDPAYTSVLYDFRTSDFNTKALAVRNASVLDPRVYSVQIGSKGFAPFKDHASFACTEKTSLVTILENWGDHMEFMSKVFFAGMDPAGEDYILKGQLNKYALLAAVASDAVAMPDATLKTKITALTMKSPAIRTSMKPSSCNETASVSRPACLAKRIFDSAVGDMGTDAWPSYAWDFPETIKAFVDLGILTASEAKTIDKNDKLVNFLTDRFRANKTAVQRAEEAFQCMGLVRDTMKNNHLGLWAQ